MEKFIEKVYKACGMKKKLTKPILLMKQTLFNKQVFLKTEII